MCKEIAIRTYKPGDPSRICYFYYKLFEKQYNFNGSVEKYFMEGMLDLFREPEGSQLWIAEREEKIVGSIAIIKRDNTDAQLRWFGVDMTLQGMGIGNRLVETAMRFCKDYGYKHVILWTINILNAARHLYAKYGFIMTDIKPNHEWASYPIVEEKWEYNE